MRKHVHGLKRNDSVAAAADSGQLPGERLRITGNVGRAPGLEPAEHLTQDGSRTPFPWGIQDHGFGITQ